MGIEMRADARQQVELPVSLEEGSMGSTCDVSASGVFFEIDSSLAVGSQISFEIEMHSAIGPMTMKCVGLVVRTEQKDGRTGVAVKMTDSRLVAVQ
ncbi:MAG: PilZ domain-containing protein [Rhodocyclaceae bacterium]|nr:PilZ domain-containing protein [Rhodocyclaceae bacterium]